MDAPFNAQKAKVLNSFKHVIDQIIRQDRGAHLVMMALLLPVLLGFAGLAIDGSNAYLQQQRMQTAADAAALAGARLLALGNSTPMLIDSEVENLATLNGSDSYTLDYLNTTEIRVTTTRTFDTFFAGIIGYNTMTVSATANAEFGAVLRTGNLLPMTVSCAEMATYTIGVEYTLHDTGKIAPGNVGWLTWDGSNSARTLAENIANPGGSSVLEVGDWVEGAPGNMNSSGVRAALDSWINQTVTIPLYDQVTGNGSNVNYRICGFAQFVLIRRDQTTLTGKFVRNVISGEEIGGGAPDFGARDIRMTQ